MFVKPYLFGALTLLSASSALALTCANDYGSSAGCASNTTAAGDCATLGYSKDNVDGCEHYLYCPFDTSYKRCATEKTPSCEELGFTKSSSKMSNWCGEIIECPYDSSYKLCKKMGCSQQDFSKSDKSDWCDNIVYCAADSSYTLCMEPKEWAFACSGYTLTQCPTNGICSSCLSGTTTKYKLDSCKSGYKLSGSSCVDAVRDCTSSDQKYLGDPGYTCPKDAITCTYCRDSWGDVRSVLTKCPDGTYINPGDAACERDCPAILSGYYLAKDAPINKKVIDSCRYYHGGLESGSYTTYYKFDTVGCNKSYNCIRSFITSGSGSYYETSCSMTYSEKMSSCPERNYDNDEWCMENQQVTLKFNWNGNTVTQKNGFYCYSKD